MSKMAKRRRKAKKTRMTESKFLKILANIKPRAPIPPVGHSFASPKDYQRKQNKKAVDEGLDND